MAQDSVLSEFVKQMVSGDLSSQIFKSSKYIYPIKRIEIRKSEILVEPDVPFEIPEEVVEEPEATEEPGATDEEPEAESREPEVAPAPEVKPEVEEAKPEEAPKVEEAE